MTNTWLVPIAVSIIAALGTYLGVVRKASGRISTTEASDLWTEAKDLRSVYQGEIARLRVEIDQSEDKLEECEEVMRQLRREVDDLHRENRRLKHHIEERGGNRAST